jgi:hypothetical protein
MKSFIRKSVLGVAMVAPMILAMPGAASAADVLAVVGTGSISPGLPCPVSCDVHLDFTLVGAGTDAAGTASCTFDGTTGADTIVAGTGNGTIDCSGGVTAHGDCHFDRTGPVVTVNCAATVNGTGVSVTAVLVFVPLSANPTTSFAVVGAGVAL